VLKNTKVLFFSNPEEGVQRALFSGSAVKTSREMKSWMKAEELEGASKCLRELK
jgi:hypothetical protein